MYIINAYYNYYISNIGLLEECDKEEKVEVTGAAAAAATTTSVFKKHCKTFCPLSRIRPVTARPALQ
jgi:hypothetical protein